MQTKCLDFDGTCIFCVAAENRIVQYVHVASTFIQLWLWYELGPCSRRCSRLTAYFNRNLLHGILHYFTYVMSY